MNLFEFVWIVAKQIRCGPRGMFSILAAGLLVFPLVLVAPSAILANSARMAENEIPHDGNRHQRQDEFGSQQRIIRQSHGRRWHIVLNPAPRRCAAGAADRLFHTASPTGHFYSNGHSAPLLR